jgi:predicted nucleotidyltransferase
MTKINQVKVILTEHKQELKERFMVKEIGLFGSYLRNEQRAGSDLDILVEFRKPVGLFEFLDLEEHLRKLLKIRVDLVSKKALKPYIGKYILKEAVYI